MAKRQVVPTDVRLHDLGYNETNWQRPGLYVNRLQYCTTYLDHRDTGGKTADEQIKQGPTFHAYPQNGRPAWLCNREALQEQVRLAAAGIKYHMSVESNAPLAGEPGYQDGSCKTCGNDFQADGVFCGPACKRVFVTNWEARNEGVPVMDLMRTLCI